jgi:hypothetical protein
MQPYKSQFNEELVPDGKSMVKNAINADFTGKDEFKDPVVVDDKKKKDPKPVKESYRSIFSEDAEKEEEEGEEEESGNFAKMHSDIPFKTMEMVRVRLDVNGFASDFVGKFRIRNSSIDITGKMDTSQSFKGSKIANMSCQGGQCQFDYKTGSQSNPMKVLIVSVSQIEDGK